MGLPRFGARRPNAFLLPLSLGAQNKRVLVVGKRQPVSPHLDQLNGVPYDFPTISAAVKEIPLLEAVAPLNERWTILVTPGVYDEEIRMKPHVSLVGYGHGTVFIRPPPGGRYAVPGDPRRATIYMNYGCGVCDVVLLKPKYALTTDYCFWNKDTYGVARPDEDFREGGGMLPLDPSYFSLEKLAIWPEPYAPDQRGKAILIEGRWHTVLMNNVLTSYCEPTGYDVELRGPGLNNDCHLTNCFFDALYLDEGDGGCMLVEGCTEVHVRNSLLRVGVTAAWSVNNQGVPSPGACVHARQNPLANKEAYVWLENTCLEAPGRVSDRALWLGPGATCEFRNSSSDSFLGDENRLILPAWPKPRCCPATESTQPSNVSGQQAAPAAPYVLADWEAVRA